MAGVLGIQDNGSEVESDHMPVVRNVGKYQDPLKGGVRSTNLEVEKYCQDWQPCHAFRELYQNWEDAIRKTNNLGRRNFKKEPHHNTSMLCFKAIHPDTREEIGFIRLLKEQGVLELTNYDAWLPGNSLNIGGTSKSGNDNMAGSHGEGYKVAALILKHHKFDVNIKASECDWEFFVPAQGEKHEGVLCVDIRRRASTRLQTAKNTYAEKIARNGPMTLRQNVWQDVTFQIGKQFKRSVTEREFLRWIECALDLEPPTRVIETPFGSIILDPTRKNKVFLKGILLEDSKTVAGSMTLKFGYNLPQGKIDRERRRLDIAEQAYHLSQIWGSAIKSNRAMLIEYVTMLQFDIPPQDVKLAAHYMSRATASLIWQYLVEENPANKKFYYNKQNTKEIEVVMNCLKKEPAPLKSELWKKLRSFGLLRTPQERRERLLCDAPESLKRESAYSTGMKRALMGILALDPKTRNLEVTFKSSTVAELDLLIHGSKLLINDKWLDFKASHECGDCDLSLEASTQNLNIDTFDCGHIITELYNALVADMSNQLGSKKLSSEASNSLLRANAGEIVVSWTESESDRVFKNHGSLRQGRITLHRESTCSTLKTEILSSDEKKTGDDEESVGSVGAAACGCPQQLVLLKDSSAIFSGLSHDEEYFPLISRKKVEKGPSGDLSDFSEDDDDSETSSDGAGTDVSQSNTSRQSSGTSTSNGSRASSPESEGSSTDSQVPQRILANIKLRTSSNDQLHRAETEIRRLEGELETAQADLISLRAEISRLMAERKSIHDELTTMTATYKKKNQQLQAANTVYQSQQHRLAEKEEALENLRLSIQGKEKEQSRIGASLEDAQTRLTSLQNEIGPLRRNQEIARAEIESLNINIQHLQTQNKKLSADLGGAETDIEHAYQQLQGRKRARKAEQGQEAAAKRSKTS
ncbi:hypothetical protein L207DRAFT_581755 [Hyaloscypha variabilis F]|uniref:Uncharacterized protein n=1 Tax=Hyaloscypha variabilis (strain UAMH 11265 / GT02V1 / F) TaxID=1149755 RepID=A0A2J6RS79_HYAVF|nr:hypothetical protein L207DRAFT_581755 [Hyaloscypha variabilis F]